MLVLQSAQKNWTGKKANKEMIYIMSLAMPMILVIMNKLANLSTIKDLKYFYKKTDNILREKK